MKRFTGGCMGRRFVTPTNFPTPHSSFVVRHLPDRPATNPKWYCTKNAEGTINQPPPDRNAAEPPKDEGVGNHHHTGQKSEIKQPPIANRIPPRAHKRQRDHEMS